jgi:hypothetical protein
MGYGQDTTVPVTQEMLPAFPESREKYRENLHKSF